MPATGQQPHMHDIEAGKQIVSERAVAQSGEEQSSSFSTECGKVIHNSNSRALCRSLIGQENSHHPLNRSDAKLKPITTKSLMPQAAS